MKTLRWIILPVVVLLMPERLIGEIFDLCEAIGLPRIYPVALIMSNAFIGFACTSIAIIVAPSHKKTVGITMAALFALYAFGLILLSSFELRLEKIAVLAYIFSSVITVFVVLKLQQAEDRKLEIDRSSQETQ